MFSVQRSAFSVRFARRVTIGAALALAAVLSWLRLGPIDASLLDRSRFQSLTIVDRHGEVIYEPLAWSGNRGMWLEADALPEHVVAATLAAEDRRFFRHPGIDPMAVGRAMLHNARAMRVVEGGSTISQQVAKLLLGAPERSLSQKAREAVLALRLEHRFDKREILALYLNLAPYGNRITGVARASRTYFGVAPAQLTPAQAAFLASLPQRPSAFNPLRDPSRARWRQRSILARMEIAADERALPVVRTTLDAGLQRDVAGIIRAQREELLRHGAHAVAVAVLDNRSGEWLAWEGSGDYFGSGFGGAIDGVTTPRQPGSALKPFTYALAFERGHTPASVVADVPAHFPTAEPGVVYSPRNYDGRYRGPLLVRSALAGSENVPAVSMLSRLGPESLLRLLRNAGFSSLDRTADYYGLGLTLGDAEVTLEQLVTAYAMFARGGMQAAPRFLAEVPLSPLALRGVRGEGRRSRTARQLLSNRTAFWITDILSDSDAREYAFGEGGSLDFPFPVAVKTGTSQAYRDNWTVGYTREVTVGVWVGNFDRSELHGSSGVTGAGPVFNAVMLAAMKRARGTLPVGEVRPVVEAPADVEAIDICTLSGARPSAWCPASRREWLPKAQPAAFCSWHHDGWIDWPAEYRGWALESMPRSKPPAVATKSDAPLRIANPADGATFLIDPTLRTEFQTLRLRADTAAGVTWHVDDRRVGTAAPGRALEWPLAPGRHTVTAVDARGRRDSVRIFVK